MEFGRSRDGISVLCFGLIQLIRVLIQSQHVILCLARLPLYKTEDRLLLNKYHNNRHVLSFWQVDGSFIININHIAGLCPRRMSWWRWSTYDRICSNLYWLDQMKLFCNWLARPTPQHWLFWYWRGRDVDRESVIDCPATIVQCYDDSHYPALDHPPFINCQI